MCHLARVLAFGSVLAVMAALCAPTEVVAQKKKNQGKVVDNGNAALPEDYKAIVNKKDLTGTIVTVSGLVVTLKVDNPHVEANPKYKPGTATNSQQYRLWQDGIRMQNDLNRAMSSKNPQQMASAMRRYQQDMMRYQMQLGQISSQLLSKANNQAQSDQRTGNNTTDPFIVVHAYKEYDLETQDKVVVRKLFLQSEFDDMGNVKKYSEKEKAELRGTDKTKPGYASKMDEVASGMEAKLYLTPPPKKKASESKADDDGVGNADRPTIRMIVLQKDAPAAASTTSPADPKKKKNK